MTAGVVATSTKNEIPGDDGQRVLRKRLWSMAEVSGNAWFAAERTEDGRCHERFIASDFMRLAPLLREGDGEAGSHWRCFAFLRASKGTIFDEIQEVIDLPQSKLLVFVLTSGFIASLGYGAQEPEFSNPAAFSASHAIAPPVFVSGTHLFRYWNN